MPITTHALIAASEYRREGGKENFETGDGRSSSRPSATAWRSANIGKDFMDATGTLRWSVPFFASSSSEARRDRKRSRIPEGGTAWTIGGRFSHSYRTRLALTLES